MNSDLNYKKAIELLENVSSSEGFLASAQDVSNYKRVWARDGVICGLAALASGDEKLIETFRKTVETIANNQHYNGTIPSNVMTNGDEVAVSYGGLAGRVDAVTWFVIGVCQYAYYTKDSTFVAKYSTAIEKCLALLEAWEFNNKGLLYVPLSGNWADEYITDGYVLYDQLLRIWALKSYNHFVQDDLITAKIIVITEQLEINFTPDSGGEKYHERAYHEILIQKYMPCSFSPAGYKNQFDAFANSLALFLNIGSYDFQSKIVAHSISLKNKMKMKLLPAFWPPIQETDLDWNLLKNNCKYEFRNYPNEFHNGGSWSMVNGFYALALLSKGKKKEATEILTAINAANAVDNFSFYENFNSETEEPNGVPFCAWSGAATVLVHQSLYTNFKFLV
ncbi:Alkaline and neutral invertase [Flavobacterium fryxellicola]|uniref:beta-fructofuranosidase n=1 Tax=Flavobacterium fryxellicola TaxID=249352 RepID=A0A167X8X8_9FLAO|nr:glycoside hydrolase 100 family protein [Flavobacterium fryxellicola]OAB28122.1 fructofuranosidase/invertase [Flavobacterium fryxellicola]SHN63716.1 Alkaline and neutral invertase [Flavobacterium fryxellicola]